MTSLAGSFLLHLWATGTILALVLPINFCRGAVFRLALGSSAAVQGFAAHLLPSREVFRLVLGSFDAVLDLAAH